MMKTSESATLTVGEKIGRWTVLSRESDNKWLCRCDCGTERLVLDRSLRYGGSKSCGCTRGVRSDRDLRGQTFGELTVIKNIENPKGNGRLWLCRCSCGAEYKVLGTLLTTGRRTRCTNSIHMKNHAYSDISGKQFGRLTAISPTGKHDKSGYLIWHCRCDCGREVDLSYNVLMYTNQKSCGCQKKEHDQKLRTYLTHIAGTSVDILKSKKVPSDNTTGYKGVYWIRGKYVAKIVFQKKAYYLGTYDNIEQAANVRKQAEELLFDSVAEHYTMWKSKADQDPSWAEVNPVQVIVSQDGDKNLSVTLLPLLTEQNVSSINENGKI